MPPHSDTLPATPKRRGNPNLHLAPRCGARTRAGCPCRAPAIRGRLRCRMHGGRSTGPRTAEGLARLRAARTVHGRYGAGRRTRDCHLLIVHRRNQVFLDAIRHRDRLPAELAARLDLAPELQLPRWPSHELTREAQRALLRAEAEALAPWQRAVALAKLASRAAPPEPHAPEAPPAAPAGAPDPQPEPHAPEASPAAPADARAAATEPHAPAALSVRHTGVRQWLLASTRHTPTPGHAANAAIAAAWERQRPGSPWLPAAPSAAWRASGWPRR